MAFPLLPMTPTDFSVLLLAWDDADPAVVVLGGSALPPTLPLVYQLAARHPVLAVYPHLPAPEATAALEASATDSAPANAATPAAALFTAPAAANSAATPGPLDATADAPGLHLLAAAAPASARPATRAGGSRLVGLDDLRPAIQQALPTAHSLMLAAGAAPGAGASTAARSQWPAHAGPQLTAAWQVPAAPYAGAAVPPAAGVPASASGAARGITRARERFPPPPPAPPRQESATETAAATSASAARSAATETPDVLAIRATPTAAVSWGTAAPAVASAFASTSVSDAAVPAPFDEPVAEMGAAEARDLDAPEDDLVPDTAPPAAAQVATETAAPESAATWAVRQPTLDGLNFRMIQYARRAAQLVDGRQDFGVIYAPGWPAWLAALEIRNRSGRPLVLYVPALASDMAPTAERGWLLGLERMVLRRATLVLVPDTEVLRRLRARHAEALGEVHIVAADDEAAVQLVLAEVARG